MNLLKQVSPIDAYVAYSEYLDYYTSSQGYFSDTIESNDFYHSRQWPKEWADELLSRGQFPLVVGKVYAVVQGVASMLTANNPSFSYSPQGTEDWAFAELHKKIGRYEWQKSNGMMHYGKAVLDFLIGGKGVLYPYVDPLKREGRFTRVIPNNYVVDPASEHPLCDDASSGFIRQAMTRRQAKVKLPLWAEAIDKAPVARRDTATTTYVKPSYSLSSKGSTILRADGTAWLPSTSARQRGSEEVIEILDRFAPVVIRVYEVVDLRNGTPYYINEDDIDEWMQNISDPSRFSIDLTHQKYYRATQMIANQAVIYDMLLPIDINPVCVMFNNHEDSPFSYGDVEHLKGLAMERNKRRSQITYNMTTMGNNKWVYEDGSINLQYWRQNQAIPGAMLPYREGYQPPTPVPPAQIPAGVEHLEQMSDVNMHEVIGHWPNQQGDPNGAPRTNQHQLTLDEMSARRLGIKMRVISTTLSRLGQVMLKYRQLYMTEERVLRISNEGGKEEALMINSEDPMNPGMKFNDLSAGEFDVVCEMESMIPSSSKAKETRALEFFDRGIYDIDSVLTSIGDPDAQKILERRSIVMQVTQQNQQLMQQNQELVGSVKNLGQQVEALMREMRVMKGTRQIENRVAETRALLDADLKVSRAKGALENLDNSRQNQTLRRQLQLEERERSVAGGEESKAVEDLIKGSLSGFLPGQSS